MDGRGAADADRARAVTLRVYAWLRRKRPDLASREVALDGIESVQGLFDAVSLAPADEVIILVNDRRAELTSSVHAGDTVCVFPMLDGG